MEGGMGPGIWNTDTTWEPDVGNGNKETLREAKTEKQTRRRWELLETLQLPHS